MPAMESDLDQSLTVTSPDNLNKDSNEFQEIEEIDLEKILDEVEKIEDLYELEEITNTLLSKKRCSAAELNKNAQLNSEVRDELYKNKCLVKELDQVHNDEQQKIDNLRESSAIRQEAISRALAQQIDDLDQFELATQEITMQFTKAPKEHDNHLLKEKINNLQKIFERNYSNLQEQIEKVTTANHEFIAPVAMESMDLPLKVFSSDTKEITSLKGKLAQSLNRISKEMDMLRFDRMTTNFVVQTRLNRI